MGDADAIRGGASGRGARAVAERRGRRRGGYALISPAVEFTRSRASRRGATGEGRVVLASEASDIFANDGARMGVLDIREFDKREVSHTQNIFLRRLKCRAVVAPDRIEAGEERSALTDRT